MVRTHYFVITPEVGTDETVHALRVLVQGSVEKVEHWVENCAQLRAELTEQFDKMVPSMTKVRELLSATPLDVSTILELGELNHINKNLDKFDQFNLKDEAWLYREDWLYRESSCAGSVAGDSELNLCEAIHREIELEVACDATCIVEFPAAAREQLAKNKFHLDVRLRLADEEIGDLQSHAVDGVELVRRPAFDLVSWLCA